MSQKKGNNETLGMSIEMAICKIYKLENNIRETRINKKIVEAAIPYLKKILKKEKITKYTGEKGNKVDFEGEDKTYSVKTNKKRCEKVCPQIIGQTTKNKFLLLQTELINKLLTNNKNNGNVYEKVNKYNKVLVNINKKQREDIKNNIKVDYTDEKIKNFIVIFVEELLEEYYNNLFCCTKLIYIKYDNKNFKSCVIKKGKKFNIKNKTIRFSKDLQNWKESTTVYIDDISIGEFQIHKNRNCIKFRFNLNKLLDYISNNE